MAAHIVYPEDVDAMLCDDQRPVPTPLPQSGGDQPPTHLPLPPPPVENGLTQRGGPVTVFGQQFLEATHTGKFQKLPVNIRQFTGKTIFLPVKNKIYRKKTYSCCKNIFGKHTRKANLELETHLR